MESLLVFFKSFCFYFIELSLLFLGISFFAALLNAKYESKIQAFLNKDSISSYLKAIFLGSLTPFCSCSTIPLFQSFLKSNIKLSIALAYLLTSPLINPIIITMLFVSFGLGLSVFYVLFLVAMILLISFMLAKLDSKFLLNDEFLEQPNKSSNQTKSANFSLKPIKNFQPHTKMSFAPTQVKNTCCENGAKQIKTSCCDQNFKKEEKTGCCEAKNTDKNKDSKHLYKQLAQKTFKDYKKILPYLLIGMGIGASIHGFVPQGFLEDHLRGFGIFGAILAALLGILLYIRAETLIPIGLALIDAGVSQGVVMSFLIAGAGCSLPELILLKSMFRLKMLGIFIAMVLGIAILFGSFVLLVV